METTKLYAIWQNNTTKGYIALTERQREAINSIPDAGLYIGFDCFTAPEEYIVPALKL